MEVTTQKVLLRVKVAAKMLDTSPSQVYNLVNQGILRSVKLGKSIRIPAEAISAMAAVGK